MKKGYYRINDSICSKKVQLIDGENKLIGDIGIEEAMAKARNSGLDLVELNRNADTSLPICKIMDYGKMQYDRSKKEKKSHQNHVHTKEIKISFTISDHDLQTKHRKIREFLDHKDRVRYVMRLRGRHCRMISEAKVLMESYLDGFEDIAVWDTLQVSEKPKSRETLLHTMLRPQ